MKAFYLFIISTFIFGCSNEHDFESYGVYVKNESGYQKIIKTDMGKPSNIASFIKRIAINDAEIVFNVYHENFDSEKYKIIQLDLFSKKKHQLVVNVTPREQPQSYSLSAKIHNSNLPIFMLVENKSLFSNSTYIASSVVVENYIVDGVLSKKSRNVKSKLSSLKDALETYPENKVLLTEIKKAELLIEQKRLEQKAITDKQDEKEYLELMLAESKNIKAELLLNKYRRYLQKYSNGLHQEEIANKSQVLLRDITAKNKAVLAAERKGFELLVNKFVSAIDDKNTKAISEVTLERSTASRASKNNLFSRVKVGKVNITKYQKSGPQDEFVQIQLEGGVYMIRANLIKNKWLITQYATKSASWFKKNG